ncbi:hypothetical protein [Thermopirellula anaerolimosa]
MHHYRFDIRPSWVFLGIALISWTPPSFARAASSAADQTRSARIEVLGDVDRPQTAFAVEEIQRAARDRDIRATVTLEINPAELGPQCYRIETDSAESVRVVGGDATGAMYGGLDVAEAIRLGSLKHLAEGVRRPYIERRGIKFNIPLDLRTPSYSDAADSFQANIPEVWSMDFWRDMLDEMARHRYNVLSLWNLHPFPSIVKVPEFPDIALNDVWRTRVRLDSSFALTGSDMVRPAMLADHEVVKRITIDEKIAFWRDVMQYARDRGVEVYWFTWNIFVWGTDGKYGITAKQDNPATIAYFRASVRETVRTYPLLAGIGVTAGEQMERGGDGRLTREQWLWQTYGEGIRDALAEQPERRFRLIHRFHQTGLDEILQAFKDYPGPFDVSFKYSIAHMYSMPNPPFIQTVLPRMPAGLRTWLTVRNDDIYSFQWGDPDYARDYIRAMPGENRTAGFYMGPDGYCWGRDFLKNDPNGPRPLVIQRLWYTFMLWGRLSFDPTLPDEHFERVLTARFRQAHAPELFQALRESSQIIPLVNRFHWEDYDFQWFPEACISHPTRYKGFHTVRDFITGRTMPGSGILDVRQYGDAAMGKSRQRYSTPRGEGGVVLENLLDQSPRITPLQVAEQLRAHAEAALRLAAAIDPGDDRELRETLDDITAMAHLGNYYAAKIEGAVALYLFDLSGQQERRSSAVARLEEARDHWRAYADTAYRRYQPQLLNRVGRGDLRAISSHVENDVDLARNWKPGTLAAQE